MESVPQWLVWARRLQALAQNGLTYARDPFDLERYTELRHISAEMLAYQGTLDPQRVAELYRNEKGYATPKVDVRAVIFGASGILLVQEREDRCWTLPGGWADVGESPSEAAERETLEEAGLPVRAVKLLAVYDRDRHGHPPIPFHAYKLFVRCECSAASEPRASGETLDASYFAEHELPQLSLTRVTEAEIRHMFDHLRHPEWPTSFD